MNAAEWSPFRAYGPRRRLAWQDMFALGLVLALCAWIAIRASRLPEYDWNWQLLLEFIVRKDNGAWRPGMLLRGLFTTLRIGFWTLLFSLLLGGALGMAFARKGVAASLPYRIFITLARNTPPLVILFSIYFFAGNMLPVSGLEDLLRQAPPIARQLTAMFFAEPGQLDRMLAAILALGLYQSAYVAEIIRAGIESVDKGQFDAAFALGFSPGQTLRLIILPQAAGLVLPPLTGQAITIFKDSALASLISLPDLTFQCLEAMAVSRMTFEIWISGAILYLLVGGTCALAGRLLEYKFTRYK